MNTNRLVSISFLLFFMVFGCTVSAQRTYVINDLLNDQKFNYTTKNLDLKDSKWNFYEEIDLEYPIITGLKDSLVQKKINKRFKQIMVDQLETDSFRLKLFMDLKKRLATFFINHSHLQDEFGTYRDNEFKFTPDITEVDFRFLSCYKSVVAFAAIFNYKTQFQDYVFEEDLNYFQVYYFNLTNGKEYKPADVFKKSSVKDISLLIENAVKKNIENLEIELEDYDNDFYDNLEIRDKNREKKLIDFSLNTDGFSYLKAFSMAFYIPSFTPCTQNIYGLDAEVRLTFDEIKKHLNPQGPFGQLINFKPDSTNFKKQNNPLVTHYDNIYTPRFLGYELTPYFIGGNIKTIQFKNVSMKSDNTIDSANIWVGRQLEYDKNGYIQQIKYYDRGKIIKIQVFNFDSSHNLVKKAMLKNGKLEEAEDFTYDKKGNLLSLSKIDTEQVPEKTFYYYTGHYSLEEHYGYYHHINGVENNYIKKTINDAGLGTNFSYSNTSTHSYNSEREQKYNKNGRLLWAYDKKSDPSAGQVYVYDKNGNLLSYEYDNGRYLYEYRYDANNNLIKETRYDGKTVSLNRKAEYDSENHLIKIEILNQNSSSPNIFFLSYEFW